MSNVKPDFAFKEFYENINEKDLIQLLDGHPISNVQLLLERVFYLKEFSEEFILKYSKGASKYFWWRVCRKQIISEAFISENMDMLPWEEVLKNQKLSIDFILKNKSRIKSKFLKMNPHLTYEDRQILLKEKILTKNEVLEFETNADYLFNEAPYLNKDQWVSISANPSLPNSFIDKYENKVFWPIISIHKKMNLEFLNKYFDKIDFFEVTFNESYTLPNAEGVYERLWEKINKSLITEAYPLSVSFIRGLEVAYKDKYFWRNLSGNPFLTLNHIEEYKSHLHFDKVINEYHKFNLPIELVRDSFKEAAIEAREDEGNVFENNVILSADFLLEFHHLLDEKTLIYNLRLPNLEGKRRANFIDMYQNKKLFV